MRAAKRNPKRGYLKHMFALFTAISVFVLLITAGATPAATLNSLREALQQLVSDDRYRSLCDALLICGYSDMSREAYAPLLAWRDEAAALGVSQL